MKVERPVRVKIVRRPLHGVLLLDKPLYLSSNDALQKVKWLLRAEKAGHTGTLDPLATGVLPICFGAATKFSHIHLDAVKTYAATLKLGVKTNTGDAEGETIAVRDVNVSQSTVEQVGQKFLGQQMQMPPMTSALKQNGKPLYELARQGIEVERAAREVTIHALDILALDDTTLQMTVTCSKGTYIRTLGEDIGEALGCGGHLTALRRIRTGDFEIAQTVTLDALEAMDEMARAACLKPVDAMLADYAKVDLDDENAGRFLSGVRRKTLLSDCEQVAIYALGHQLLGSAHIKAGELIPTRLLSPLDIQQMQLQEQKI